MARGGARPGAGRPKGGKNKATLEREVAFEHLEARILAELDPLIRAQLTLATGALVMFAKEAGKWVRVRNVARIEAILSDEQKENGEDYYYIAAQEPDGRMLDGLMNRVFGKPTERHEHSGPGGGPIPYQVHDHFTA